MVKKYWPILVLIILVVGVGVVYLQVRNYQAEQRRRVAALQAEAEEVKVTIIEGWT